MLADKNDSFNLNMFWPFQQKMVSTVIKAFKPFGKHMPGKFGCKSTQH